MSSRIPDCPVHHQPLRPTWLGQVDPEHEEDMLGAGWACAEHGCQERVLDVFPSGPIVPSPHGCLSCAAFSPRSGECEGCGLSRAAALAELGLEPEPPADPLSWARQRLAEGLVRSALGELNRTLAADQSVSGAWSLKGRFFQQLAYHRRAVDCLTRAWRRADPDDDEARVLGHDDAVFLAVSYQAQGEAAQAEAVYRELLAADLPPRQAIPVVNNLGNVLLLQGRLDEARQAYRDGWAAAPESGILAYGAARTEALLGNFEQAWAGLEAGLGLTARAPAEHPERVFLLAEASWVLNELNRPQEALAHAQQALELDQTQLKARFQQGRARASLGELVQARTAFEQVLALEPEHAEAQAAIRRLDEVAGLGRGQRY